MTYLEEFQKNSFVSIKGKNPGNTVTVFVGIHGNEKVGIKAINNILPDLRIDKGTLNIALGNPKAAKENVRYIDENLNRLFTKKRQNGESYESKRVKDLLKILDKSDTLLDIHSSNSKKTTPFIITEEKGLKYAKFFPFPIVTFGWNHIEPGGSDGYMNTNGKIGLTLECGSSHNSDEYVKIAEDSIYIFLDLFGLISYSKKTKQVKQKLLFVKHAEIKKTNDFSLIKSFDDFEKLEKGEIYAVDGEKKFIAKEGEYIIFARDDKKIGEEVFILAEDV